MKRLALRYVLGAAALSVAGCFGTGVAPAKNATLVAEPAVDLASEETSELTVRNADARAAVARNVRLRAVAGARPLTELIEVRYGADCTALAPGASCTIEVQPTAAATAADFPLRVRVGGDNTNAVEVTLALQARERPEPQGRLQLSAAFLAPPAPAAASLGLRNAGRGELRVLGVDVPEAAKLTVDPSTCKGFPYLAGGANCSFRVLAPAAAVPGTYAVRVRYVTAGREGQTATSVTVVPGPLVVNDGASIALDSNTSVLAVAVRNAGFDVQDLAIALPWSDECRGAPSLTVDTSDCPQTLGAGRQCTVRLTTFGATPGVGSALTAEGVQGIRVFATEQVAIGSLLAASLRFTEPGRQQLQLVNLASRPLSVVAVRVGGNHSAGLSAPSPADLRGCQNFTGTCVVDVEASSDAYAGDGASSLTVTYRDGDLLLQADAGIEVAPSTVVVGAGQPIVLPAGPGLQQVPLRNVGPFAVTSPNVVLQPPLVGVTVTHDCPEVLPPGASCNANVVATAASVGGQSANFVLTGANVAATGSSQPLQVQPALLAVGTAGDGTTRLLVSYDAGTSWAVNANVATNFVGHRAAMGRGVWLVAGSRNGCQAVAYSRDMGQNWNTVDLPAAGSLHGAAWARDNFVVVGENGGEAVIRTSRDGATWGAAIANLQSAELYAVACRQGACVATGSGTSLGAQTALHSYDGGNIWAPLADSYLAPPFSGTLLDAATDGNTWLLAGVSTGGRSVLLPSQGDPAGPYDTVGGVLSGTDTLRGAAGNGNSWLAVGGDGAQLVTFCAAPTANAWPAAAIGIGAGTLYDVIWAGGRWIAVGDDGSSGVVRTSGDGASWTTQVAAGVVSINAVVGFR